MVRSYIRRRIDKIGNVEVHELPLTDVNWPPITYDALGRLVFPSGVLLHRGGFLEAETTMSKYYLAFTINDERGVLAGVLTGSIGFDEYGYPGTEASISEMETSTKRSGLGRQLVNAFEEKARKEGTKRIWLDAQMRAYGFWRKLGYTPTAYPTELLDERVLIHKDWPDSSVRMEKRLQ